MKLLKSAQHTRGIQGRVGDGSVGHGSMGHMGRHYSMGHMGHGSVGADP